jgi:hypothetical protein
MKLIAKQSKFISVLCQQHQQKKKSPDFHQKIYTHTHHVLRSNNTHKFEHWDIWKSYHLIWVFLY